MDDSSILEWADAENRIVITSDTDYGEIVFRQRRPHPGVVLLRLADQTPHSKTVALRTLLENYGHLLAGNFVVTSGTAVRINKFNSPPTAEIGP
jgi:predicted nuclease of predicted toxin-antitoxin system